MEFSVDISQEIVTDMDTIIGSFVNKYAEEVVSIGALAMCLQTLIDKRDEIQKMIEEGENE